MWSVEPSSPDRKLFGMPWPTDTPCLLTVFPSVAVRVLEFYYLTEDLLIMVGSLTSSHPATAYWMYRSWPFHTEGEL